MSATSSPRGLVVPLTADQIVARASYLARLPGATTETLDKYVRKPPAPRMCDWIYYRLQDHNGGKDPCAIDPADRWVLTGQTNRTSDCSGGNAWMHGFDRYQPKRMAAAVGYDGWWNTDSKIIDATRIVTAKSGPRCFEAEETPFLGAIIVCKSGSRGHKIGHEETVIDVPAEWDPRERECWAAIKTSGIRGSGAHANGLGTGTGWWNTGAMFLRSVMTP